MFLLRVMIALTVATVPLRAQSKPSDSGIKDFRGRVQHYWDLHKKLENAAKPSALGDSIRAARRNAGEGEIFTPAAQKIFVATITQALSSGRGAKTRQTILGEGNPKGAESESQIPLVVNARYPANAPVSSVPLSVLLRLPKLPAGLEYRFVGRHLILYDSPANLIVDIMRNAIR